MKVNVLVAISDGEGHTFKSGRAYDMPDDDQTKSWLAAGFVEQVDPATAGKSGKTKSGKKSKAPKGKTTNDAETPPAGSDAPEDDKPDGSAEPDAAEEPLRGAALDEALTAADLSKSGTVAEKQARLAEHAASVSDEKEDDVDKSTKAEDETATAEKSKVKRTTTTRRAPRTTEKG